MVPLEVGKQSEKETEPEENEKDVKNRNQRRDVKDSKTPFDTLHQPHSPGSL